MLLFTIIEQCLVFLPFSLGVYLSYSVLNKADLTVDGSFVLGAAVYGLCVLNGKDPLIAVSLATLVGFAAGGGVALLQYRDKMTSLIAGILALFMLQSINLALMGRPNLNLLGQSSLLQFFEIISGVSVSKTFSLAILSLFSLLAMGLLMHSRLGLLFRAFGDNAHLMRLMGYRPELMRFLGLGLSNSLVALSGALIAQYQGYVDIGMGMGNVLIGIGTVIIGQQTASYCMQGRHSPVHFQLLFCTLGVFAYFAVLNSLVAVGVSPIYLKLTIGGTIAALLLLQQPKLGVAR